MLVGMAAARLLKPPLPPARAVVWEGHGRAEELGELLRRALVHALQRHGEVEPVRKSNFGRPTPSTRHSLTH